MKILCLGDSLTVGMVTMWQQPAPYSDMLRQMLVDSLLFPDQKIEIQNVAENGAVAAGVLHVQLSLSDVKNLQWVIVLVGTNDIGMLGTYGIVEALEGVRSIIAALLMESPAANIALVSVPPMGVAGYKSQQVRVCYNRQLASLVQEHRQCHEARSRSQLHYVDWYSQVAEVVETHCSTSGATSGGVEEEDGVVLPQLHDEGMKELVQLQQQYNGDGLHLSAKGYEVLAQMLFQVICKDEKLLPQD